MITVRVSKTDPAATSSLGKAVREHRYAGADLHLRVAPGEYVEPLVIGVRGRVVVTPEEGAGTVTVVATGETNVFNVHEGGSLELHGISVRSTSEEYPPLYVQKDARLKAVDCVFTAPRRVNVVGARAEVVGCRFEDSGLLWDGSEGSVSECYFAGAVIAVQGRCSPKISGTVFTGAHDDWHTLYVANASPEFTDCALVDGGGVYVRDRARAEFTDLRVTGSYDWPVRVYERSRATFTRMVVEGARKEDTDAFFVHGDSEATLNDCEITDATRTGVAIEGGKLTVEGLTVDGTATDAVLVDGGQADVTDLRCTRIGKAALLIADGARVTVSGMSVAESGVEERGAIASVRSRFEVSDLRVSRWHGPMAIVVGGRGYFEDIVGHDVGSGIHSREDATLTVRGMVLRDAREDGLNILDGTEVQLHQADLSDCGEDAVYVQGGHVTVRSSTLSGSGERGIRVGEGGVAALEDTSIRDGRGDGVMVEEGGRVRLVRCTVTGNDEEGLWAADSSSVYLEETTFSGNRGGDANQGGNGDRAAARVAGTGAARPDEGGTAAQESGDATVRDRARPLETLLAELEGLVGLDRVKKEVRALVNIQTVSAKRMEAGFPPLNVSRHLVLSGPSGSGRATVARLYGEILRSLGLLSQGQFVTASRDDLVADRGVGSAQRTADLVERARGGVLFVAEAYALSRGDGSGQEAVDTLSGLMEELRDEVVVVLSGPTNGMRALLDANPELRARVARTVEFEGYSPEQLGGIFEGMAEERGYTLGEGARDLLLRHFRGRIAEGSFGHGREARAVFEEVLRVQAERITAGGYQTVADLTRIRTDDLGGVVAEGRATATEAVDGVRVNALLASLDGMVGLGEVKRQVKGLTDLLCRARSEGDRPPAARHLVFLGPPGTGKGTVARLYGELLAAVGVLPRGHVVEASPGSLVGPPGQRGPGRVALRTRELFERARGGLLLLSDAEVLNRDFTGGRGVGQEVVDTLLRLMEEHRDEVVVVVSGRARETTGFLADHPGLAARLSRTLEFSSYDREELAAIFVGMAERADLLVPEATRRALSELLGVDSRGLAEGGGHRVRALFEAGLTRQARRIEAAALSGESPDVDQLRTLLPEDLPDGGPDLGE
ncbi:right-handed parallel beta-helix repeat-containing protein [Nocardiopsis sp. B62]|uniref:right-handed parallel beta-helix repeat-containing protein n=1 Tax=Nocardiopsis sp. B62 TaxID=2824874 RepID=UPI001B376023|nr:right-handed parallel beta-helix repeat-containing protein [Nocardiopsis sp. B62]MBQ1080177.1 right-handed parallel beta-helix repeat-containing protein [Nocardiopsis sp. B62]